MVFKTLLQGTPEAVHRKRRPYRSRVSDHMCDLEQGMGTTRPTRCRKVVYIRSFVHQSEDKLDEARIHTFYIKYLTHLRKPDSTELNLVAGISSNAGVVVFKFFFCTSGCS